MSAEKLAALCDAMGDAPFTEGQHVFEQGDEGDAFYVITQGSAVVRRGVEGADDSLMTP